MLYKRVFVEEKQVLIFLRKSCVDVIDSVAMRVADIVAREAAKESGHCLTKADNVLLNWLLTLQHSHAPSRRNYRG